MQLDKPRPWGPEKGEWYVVVTRPRAENRAAANLRRAGYKVYLPKMRKDIVHHRTKRKLATRTFILFNRYLLVRVRPEQGFLALRACGGVTDVLSSTSTSGRLYSPIPGDLVAEVLLAQRKMLFDDTARARIRRANGLKAMRQAETERFPVGAQLRIRGSRPNERQHPFGGFYAQVSKVSAKGRIVIEALLSVFGRLSTITLEPEDVEIAAPARAKLDAAAIAA